MTIIVNGQARELAAATLDALLEALDLGGAVVATAVNGRFVRAAERPRDPPRRGRRGRDPRADAGG